MAQAAAEQGRLNQQVAIASANNQLAREQSNQGALLTQDQIRSGYDTTMRDLILNASKANAANNLAYLGFDENARQFNQTLAQQQTQANRDYQMGRLGYNQKDQQYYAGLNQDASQFGQTLAEQQAKRQQDAVLQALGYQYQYGDLGAKGSATGPASEFVKDLPNLMAAIADEASAGPVNASKWIAIMRAQYPGVDPMSYPQVVDLLDRAAMASGLPGAFAPPTGK